MVTESTKKLRELLAFVLLGVVTALVLVSLSLLFKDMGGPMGGEVDFSMKAALIQGDIVNPVYVVLLVTAVVLVTHLGEPTAQARTITIGAMAVLGVMGLLGLLTWISSLSVEEAGQLGLLSDNGGLNGAEKIGGSFAMIVLLALIGIAIYFCLTTLQALPSTPKAGQQQWGAQPQQGHWGGQVPPQGQWGGQPQQGHEQWAPQQNAGSWGQPQESAPGQWGAQPGQDQWGQPQQPEPQQWDGQTGAPQGSWGQPQEAPPGQWDGQTAPPQQSSWGQPQQPDPYQWGAQVPAEEQTTQAWSPAQDSDEDSSWDRSSAASSEETSVFNPAADDADNAVSDASDEAERDDRPGWWNPGR